MKRIYLCVENLPVQYNYMFLTSLNKIIPFSKRQTSQQNGKTYTSYSQMFDVNDNSMNGTCNTYVQYTAQEKELNRKISVMINFFFDIDTPIYSKTEVS